MDAKEKAMFRFPKIAFVICLSCAWFSSSAYSQNALAIKMEHLRNSQQELDWRWRRMGPGKKLVAYAKRSIPFYSWINLCNAYETDTNDQSAIWLTDCLNNQTNDIFTSTTAQQFAPTYDKVVNELWEENPLDAITFAQFAMGLSSKDQTLISIASVAHPIAVLLLLLWIGKRIFGYRQPKNAP